MLKRGLPGSLGSTGDRAAKRRKTPETLRTNETHKEELLEGTAHRRDATLQRGIDETKPRTAGEATRPGCIVARGHNRGQPVRQRDPCVDQGGAKSARRGRRQPRAKSRGARHHGDRRDQRRARSRGDHQSGKRGSDNAQQRLDPQTNKGCRGRREVHRDSNTTNVAGSDITPPETKKRQRNASRGAKKGDRRETGEPAEAATPGPSKKAKTSNGEQISIIVQECLKSMAPLLFVKPGGGGEEKEPRGTEVREGSSPRRSKGKKPQAARAVTTPDRSISPDSGGEEPALPGSPARPTQAWGVGPNKSAHRRRHPTADGQAPEAYKRGTLGRPYMVARAPWLASLIPLAVKERIWRREFIDIFTLLEIQVEGLDLTTVDKKEKDRRERNRVRKERNFDNWLDAFRIMAYIIVDKFPHCAKDLWLYESKIHEAHRQFSREAWLDYDKGFRLKMQAHPDMEWDEEDVAGYMHKMMVAREARNWAHKGEQPFHGSFQKSRHEKGKPYPKRQPYTQWKGPKTGRTASAICYKFEKDEFLEGFLRKNIRPFFPVQSRYLYDL
ncbi:hypothetical protein NDU88_002209 [Pleurodeles waltl]|uniref:Uncharacterized protein n=1 Tax=Pleurodeles waltl TaxID=8319 RepID=A0AAV7MPV9_PLEWA|nr:hypothetical protein NDU88_002209 [Pleurodeles waltl]